MNLRMLFLLVGLVYALGFAYFQRWKVNIVYGGDAWGYYGYLPAAFLYADLKNPVKTYEARFAHVPEQPFLPGPGGELPEAPNGNRVIKYTMGVAILQAPFFGLGLLAAKISGAPVDGYSPPFIWAIHLSVFFYFFLGIWWMFQVLRRETSERTAFWTVLTIALATNIFHFVVYRGPMAHSYLFALYAGLLYATVRFYERPRAIFALLIGLTAGLITLIRPVEIFCLAIPFLYGLGTKTARKERVQFWGEHLRLVLLAAGVFILCGIPQMLYWKMATGHWYFDGYPGEQFFFNKPKIWKGLFSTQNGWLVYTPVMMLALVGIRYLFRHRNWLWPVLVILPVHVYIAYSWWCWNYINGFGSRPMVELYPLLALPLAYSLHYAARRIRTGTLAALFVLACTVLNFFQSWQHYKGILWSEAVNRAYYWSVFGKTKMDYGDLVAFDSPEMQPDTSRLARAGILFFDDFEQDTLRDGLITTPVHHGHYALELNPGRRYFSMLERTLEQTGLAPGDYLRISALCRKTVKESPWYMMPSIICEIFDGDRRLRHRLVRIDSKLDNPDFSLWGGRTDVWGEVYFFVKIPSSAGPGSLIKVYVSAETHPLYLDDARVEWWRRR